MIAGFLNAHLEIVVPLRLRDVNELHEIQIDAVLDTGFDDYLTLPPEVIARLSLPFVETISVILADGSRIETNVHLARLTWENEAILVRVQEAAGEPLLGMLQLFGHRVMFDVMDGGTVEIMPLTPREEIF